MMNQALLEIKNLLETSMGAAAATYYAGDVGLPYKNSLPAVIVRELRTQHERPSTTKDKYRFTISILVVMDMVKSFDIAGLDTDRVMKSRENLRKLMEEEDTDGAPKTTTVLGTLTRQSNLRGNYYVYLSNPDINYRPAAPRGFFYVAAEVTISVLSDFITRKA